MEKDNFLRKVEELGERVGEALFPWLIILFWTGVIVVLQLICYTLFRNIIFGVK